MGHLHVPIAVLRCHTWRGGPQQHGTRPSNPCRLMARPTPQAHSHEPCGARNMRARIVTMQHTMPHTYKSNTRVRRISRQRRAGPCDSLGGLEHRVVRKRRGHTRGRQHTTKTLSTNLPQHTTHTRHPEAPDGMAKSSSVTRSRVHKGGTTHRQGDSTATTHTILSSMCFAHSKPVQRHITDHGRDGDDHGTCPRAWYEQI